MAKKKKEKVIEKPHWTETPEFEHLVGNLIENGADCGCGEPYCMYGTRWNKFIKYIKEKESIWNQ